MSTDTPTISETIAEIREALTDYIEATYHIGNASLVDQRRKLLEEVGVIFQVPYIETTPRYLPSAPFAQLGLPGAAAELFRLMSDHESRGSRLLYDPPYQHQAKALQLALNSGRSLVVATGTGSGKTEAFLLPMIGRLAVEAQARPRSFASPAVRAILLYPMNALVNDQLGRLRLMVGDKRVSDRFISWAGRPARFARYTSRTLYPGVRTAKKDQLRLRAIGQFYVELEAQASDGESPEGESARSLVEKLRARGKWPAKPDLQAWYGRSGARWQDNDGEYLRAVTLPGEPELLTRHEVLAAPPDVLITNYSMLEYMMMRPLERPIFDATRNWLDANPDERLLLVIDEAHLYRGAAGAEVGLLLRRLRARLGISADRLQVICTSASFSDVDQARIFAAQLSGKAPADFETVVGELALRPSPAKGLENDARALADVSLRNFYESETESDQIEILLPFLESRGVTPSESVATTLFEALHDYPPMSLLVNLTMTEARPLAQLGSDVFEIDDPILADRAVTTLIALGSVARRSEGEPGLLPCRIHSFFRGLPGLWACVDAECPEISPGLRAPVGKTFAQPRDTCDCGARVFELFTCRHCGAAYARAYTDDLDVPTYLWSEPGQQFLSVSGVVPELQALDLCLEDPIRDAVEPADLDLITGRLNPPTLGERTRQVFLKRDRGEPPAPNSRDSARPPSNGEFRPCGVCGQSASYGRSSVQDHQTKGDEPFQALITRQIQVQPAGRQPYSDFAPLQGRKVLTFSDSRQTAARLAPKLQTYSMRDVLRPLILVGMRQLEGVDLISPELCLEHLYLAVLLGATMLRVRLRPELRAGESLQAHRDVEAAVLGGDLSDPAVMLHLFIAVGRELPPESLRRAIVETLTERYYGLQSLALASLAERRGLRGQLVQSLPALGSVVTNDEEKVSLLRFWLNNWTEPGIWFQGMTPEWWLTQRGIRSHRGKFAGLTRWLDKTGIKRDFERNWLPILLNTFCEALPQGKFRIRAGNLTLNMDASWGYCLSCRATQRPFPGSAICVNCGRDRVQVIDPERDQVFVARKGYYRNSSLRALKNPPEPPMSIIAAEHTAQLNAADAEEVFSKAEENELLFQDVDLGPGVFGQTRPAIDVLSCTTTMEVGIDIGTLSGVALRNMPPSRANYQQRSGRAGRRGNSVATVVAFGSADSHDEHYFREPDAMIRGRVDDPLLTLDNAEIARRHVTAFLLQRYHQARLPQVQPEDQPHLFEVLGTVEAFKRADSTLSRSDFGAWLQNDESSLVGEVDGWLPRELVGDERASLLAGVVGETLSAIDYAISDSGEVEDLGVKTTTPEQDDDDDIVESPPETGEERQDPRRAGEFLLDRLLYKGVLPRYAFPTDVVAFHVFDRDRSTSFRPVFRYAPAQGLPIALSQYAPGKEVWVDGKLWTSGALYSPMRSDLPAAWRAKKLYFECSICHYAKTEGYGEAERGEVRDCPACGGEATFGRAKNWIRPPGFAHPQSVEEGTSPDDLPAKSYATRAKLVVPGPADPGSWSPVTDLVREYYARTYLLVSNTGPRQEGYSYCTRCGLIEPTASPTTRVAAPHTKPYPDSRQQECQGGVSTTGLVLGTDFITDVLLISLTVAPPLTLRPGYLANDVALRTLCEAFTIASTRRLEIDGGELQAEHRPALTQAGREGLEAEIYLYDTLAGGAGFARRIADLGLSVFEVALDLLENCPSGCDRSCYRCLRSFGNRFEHDLLDRHLGASLLRYLLHGTEPTLNHVRVGQATDRVFADLSRQGIDGLRLTRRAVIDIAGIGAVEAPILAESGTKRLMIGIHGPLTPDFANDGALRDAKEFGSAIPVLLLDEIVISRNLPRATSQVIEALAE